MKKCTKYICVLFIYILTIFSPSKVYASIITFNKGNITLELGTSSQIQYTLKEELNSSNIIWTSSNPSVATVSNGLITTHEEGTTIITASIDGYNATCKITVNSNYIRVNNIKLNKSNTTLLVGETETLKATINPVDATNQNILWTSSDPSVATVNNGTITAKGIGTTIITASIDGYNTTCKVTVTYSMSLKGISINKTTVNLKEKQTEQLNIIYNPTNATNKKVTWKSSNNSVVTVNSSGLLTAISKGSATITAVSNEGGYVATCKVTVEEISKKVTEIKLDKTDLKLLSGESTNLIATILPDYAENKKIIWTSSDETIATVENGTIIAKFPGTTEIKVTTEDGNKEAICKVSVTAPPLESIAFQEIEQTIYVGSEIKLEVNVYPTTAILENAIWNSSDESVAIVKEGNITAITPGETIITVTNLEGTINATTKIIVIEEPKEPFNIIVEGYSLKFNPNKLNYSLKIGKEKELKISTNVNKEDVIIKGNQNLSKGSIITIVYTGTPDVTYVISIQKKENYTIYFIAAISLLLLINLIRILIKNKKKEEF